VPRRILSKGLLIFAAVLLLPIGFWPITGKSWHVFLVVVWSLGGTILLLWFGWRVLKLFLYKVGRRLAFSYFLIGGLPIPMVLLLLGVGAYLLASYFIGHLFRDALSQLAVEVSTVAESRLDSFARTGTPPALQSGAPDIVVAYYRRGRRIDGDPRLPETWPGWAMRRVEVVAATPAPASSPSNAREVTAQASAQAGTLARSRSLEAERDEPFFSLGSDSPPTLAAAAVRGTYGVAAMFAKPLDRELSERSGLWVEINRPDEQGSMVNIELGNRILPFMHLRQMANRLAAERFFRDIAEKHDFWDRPLLWWGQMTGPLSELGNGHLLAEHLIVTLNGTPRVLTNHLFSITGEVDATAWGALLTLAVLLLNVYVIAALMAIYMIVGLSRAVNRLSAATEAVRRGDFAARIDVRRRDQVGDLQKSFNVMTANLEHHVEESTQKELLEKELDLARNLQKSLLPRNLPRDHGVEFATLFEPSAAIGGDYFDVMRLSPHEIVVIIADVSGHGLASGLRMAMLKSALLILVEDTRDPGEILNRLDRVVRNEPERRYFVTATLGIIDLDTGRMRLLNAGHPPTYRIHGQEVEEIVLPGSALGGLGHSYGRRDVALEPGDLVVWLSDGLIEATNAADEPFGYDQVIEALRPPKDAGVITAASVRDQLLAAVDRHMDGQPPADDRTLVVVRWANAARRPDAEGQRDEEAVRDATVATAVGVPD
jgi:serine phosphatase RsbU (regulator of sigma subunit)